MYSGDAPAQKSSAELSCVSMSLGISATEAERRCGRRDAIRNMRRAEEKGSGSVTARTLTGLAPALNTTAEWLLTGQGKKEAEEVTELLPAEKLAGLDDDRVTEAFGWAFNGADRPRCDGPGNSDPGSGHPAHCSRPAHGFHTGRAAASN